jgi:Effector Associated Constant Component 1
MQISNGEEMTTESYQLAVEAADDRAAGEAARYLSDDMREVEGVIEAERKKADHGMMDLGSIVTVVASSGATLALARGVAEWIRTRLPVLVIRFPHLGGNSRIIHLSEIN